MVDVGLSDGNLHMLVSANSLPFLAWHHVGATWDGAMLSLYVNGQLEGTLDLSGRPPIHFNGDPLTIGRHHLAGRGFDGLIDEVEFFGRALTAAEMASIHDAGTAGKCKQGPNSPPVVASDADPVVVDEGQTANNTGTVGDPDGDVVSLSADVGSITNNNDGTWSWSVGTTDGPGESQTVTITADDGNGGSAQAQFTLTVNNVSPTVTSMNLPIDPVAIGDQPIAASADFSDAGGAADAPYTCTVDYGDGSGPTLGTVVGTTCTGADQTYLAAGVYTVTAAVTDKDGDNGSFTSETMVVIYDPSGGFVTGGGWITSPAGAYASDPTISGRASFGFVSKYRKGATVPTGNTEFQFKAGDLNFHSSSYDFLVISAGGTNAQYKGAGTINGSLAPTGSPYKFMLWARDETPGGADIFRIRIWYEDGSEIEVYDNSLGAGFGQEIGGGSIVIHTK